VTFDPTPAAGRIEPVSAGLAARLGKYAEALELIWFQYVVGYDKQEQRSLATSLHNHLFAYRSLLAEVVATARRTASSHSRRIALIGFITIAALLLLFAALRVRRLGWRRGLSFHEGELKTESSKIVFYERLISLLERGGVKRDPDLTPLEFAGGLGLHSVLAITRAYNRVRFGGQELSPAELREIDHALKQLEGDMPK
ncbi:MAG TPA: DUF4129 domain-containing protein, partial [Pyrinomonadaceae bacterium]|jgi:hypothetical protein|nr:DUF4129 domain-containing protein [Pyrinomonadaceae bacterium]